MHVRQPTREKVLKAATSLFAAKGFNGTSTRDVAKRGRVNESTIFRLFKNKQDLYLQILDRQMGLSTFAGLDPILQSSDDHERMFLLLAERLQEVFNPTFVRLLFFAALEKPELLRKRFRPRLVSFYEKLGSLIQAQIESGVLRRIEPDLMGRALVSMVVYHEIFREVLSGPSSDAKSRECAKVYAEIWLSGTLARSGPAA